MTTTLYERFTYPSQWVGAGTHWLYTMTLTDKAGVAIPISSLATVTLTLMDLGVNPPGIVNARLADDIKNANGGAISGVGVLSLTLSGGDTAMLNSSHAYESRRARIEWTKTGSGDVSWREVDFIVTRKTPTA